MYDVVQIMIGWGWGGGGLERGGSALVSDPTVYLFIYSRASTNG